MALILVTHLRAISCIDKLLDANNSLAESIRTCCQYSVALVPVATHLAI